MKTLIIIAILFLLGAVFLHFPYSYYQLLRWVVCAAAVMLAYKTTGGKQAVAVTIALLFNPIIPVHLDRSTWAVLDAGAAVSFASIGLPLTPQKEKK